MRTFGYVLFIACCFGLYKFNEEVKRHDPLPAGYSVEDSLRTERGKAEAARDLDLPGPAAGEHERAAQDARIRRVVLDQQHPRGRARLLHVSSGTPRGPSRGPSVQGV